MPLSAGAVLTKSAATTRSASTATSATSAKAFPVSLLGTVHAASEGSPFHRTFAAASTIVASLVKSVTTTKSIVNPPAAQLFKQDRTAKLATQANTATVTNAHTAAIKILTASTTVVPLFVRAKLVRLVAGYNNALPPTFIGVGSNAAVGKQFVLGKTLLGTSSPLGSTTLRIAYTTLAATVLTAASVARQNVTKLRTVTASLTSSASISRSVAAIRVAPVVTAPMLLAAKPYVLLATTPTFGHLTTVYRATTAIVTFPSLPPGTFTLVSTDPTGGFTFDPTV